MSDFANCDHLIANTPRIAADIEAQGWPASRVSYIPNFVPEVSSAPARRAAFNTPEDAPLILWAGRISHEMGADLAVRAIAEAPKVYLWMAGAGPYEDDIKRLAAQMGVLGRIRFLGWRDDINALLKAADVYVHSFRCEGLGNLLEALCNGLPVVSSSLADTNHLLGGGHNGLLVAKDDPAALAVALNKLISNADLALRLGEAGKAHFRTHFSEETVVGMYLELCWRLEEEYGFRKKPLPKASAGAPKPAPA